MPAEWLEQLKRLDKDTPRAVSILEHLLTLFENPESFLKTWTVRSSEFFQDIHYGHVAADLHATPQ